MERSPIFSYSYIFYLFQHTCGQGGILIFHRVGRVPYYLKSFFCFFGVSFGSVLIVLCINYLYFLQTHTLLIFYHSKHTKSNTNLTNEFVVKHTCQDGVNFHGNAHQLQFSARDGSRVAAVRAARHTQQCAFLSMHPSSWC